MLREFAAGFGTLLRGFGMWRTHPRLMALGLIPALIAFAVLAALLIPFGLSLGGISAWITPFADGWIAGWRDALRITLGIVLFLAALALSAVVFTALALIIGDPFYQRIWRGVEKSLGGPEPTGASGFWQTVGEGLRLVLLGLGATLITLAIGLIPLVGGFLGAISGVVLPGRVLARELTGRAFDARGLSPAARSALLSSHRARVLGFGVATQLCFMIPLGAVATMPAAVAGSTILARSLADGAGRTPAGPPAPPAAPGPPPPPAPARPAPDAPPRSDA